MSFAPGDFQQKYFPGEFPQKQKQPPLKEGFSVSGGLRLYSRSDGVPRTQSVLSLSVGATLST